MAAPALLAAVLAVAAHATQLPSINSERAKHIHTSANWWARVEDKVYYSPPVSMLELSQDVSNYYYALGSHTALTDELKACRVGGEGRWHIFHLPKGTSMLQTASNGDRRSTLSSLVQLQHGEVLGPFPEYKTNATYAHPGSAKAQELERHFVNTITAAEFKAYLTQITNLGVDGVDTRSWDNLDASKVSQAFLQQEFQKMGLASCLHKFENEGKQLANVVAYVPGKDADSVTLGAHYDSRPFTGAAPGAEDNGSGVAALLMVAKTLMKAKVKPAKNIYFVAFAAEEPGLLGSAQFASALKKTNGFATALENKGSAILGECSTDKSFLQQKQRAATQTPKYSAIVLDEVGWKSPNLSGPTVNLESKDWTYNVMNHLAQANKDHNGADLEVIHNSNPFGSDHMSFLDNDMEGVLVINGDDEGYPDYHKSSDKIENVDMEYASKISRMVFGGLMREAGLQV